MTRHLRKGPRAPTALDAQVPCAFVLADAVYGSDSRLRRMLEEQHQAYVLAVRANHQLRFWNKAGLIETDPEALSDALSPADWAAHAAGEGTKGLRLYDWARVRLPWASDAQWERWLLIRRNRRDPAKQAYYLVFAPIGTTLAELAGVARLRWTIEECFERAKDELGLDHCEARSWHGWHRHTLLVCCGGRVSCQAECRLAPHGIEQTERNESNAGNRRLTMIGALVPTVPEIRYLLARLVLRPPLHITFVMAWSLWRRQHQANAAFAHYSRRSNAQL
jgi:Transposase DDE domain